MGTREVIQMHVIVQTLPRDYEGIPTLSLVPFRTIRDLLNYLKEPGAANIETISIDPFTDRGEYSNIHRYFFKKKKSLLTVQAQELAEFIKNNPFLKSLTIIDHQMTTQAVKLIANAIQDSSIQYLQLSNEMDPASGIELAKMLINNRTIRILNLNCNNFGTEGLEALGEALKNNHVIETLNLSYSMLSSMSVKLVIEAASLSLNLCGMQKLCENLSCKIQFLNLKGNVLDICAITSLSNALEANRSLKEINLSANRIGDPEIQILLDGFLKNNTSIEVIDLSLNRITTCGATALVEVLKNCSTIKRIDLTANPICSEGVESIITTCSRDTPHIEILISADERTMSRIALMRSLPEFSEISDDSEQTVIGDSSSSTASLQDLADTY